MSGPHEFVRGSVILCAECRRPIYALERGIGPWETSSRAVTAFRPLRRADMDDLMRPRPDVPVWYQNYLRVWLQTPQARKVFEIERPRTGDSCDCPYCGGTWVHFEERLEGSAHDRGYRLNLLDVPPLPARMTKMRRKRWMHDPDPDREVVIEERPAL